MTEQIKSAIDIMENEMPHCGTKLVYTEEERTEAYIFAIRSLKAWEEVLTELEEEREEILNSNDYESEIVNYCLYNFDKAIDIINQKLADVPDTNVGEIEERN